MSKDDTLKTVIGPEDGWFLPEEERVDGYEGEQMMIEIGSGNPRDPYDPYSRDLEMVLDCDDRDREYFRVLGQAFAVETDEDSAHAMAYGIVKMVGGVKEDAREVANRMVADFEAGVEQGGFHYENSLQELEMFNGLGLVAVGAVSPYGALVQDKPAFPQYGKEELINKPIEHELINKPIEHELTIKPIDLDRDRRDEILAKYKLPANQEPQEKPFGLFDDATQERAKDPFNLFIDKEDPFKHEDVKGPNYRPEDNNLDDWFLDTEMGKYGATTGRPRRIGSFDKNMLGANALLKLPETFEQTVDRLIDEALFMRVLGLNDSYTKFPNF